VLILGAATTLCLGLAIPIVGIWYAGALKHNIYEYNLNALKGNDTQCRTTNQFSLNAGKTFNYGQLPIGSLKL